MITLLRVLFGFIVACLVAGLVTVAFVVTPADIANLPPEAQPERLGNAGILALLAATHSAIFALPFAIIAIGIAELSRVRTWIYYCAGRHRHCRCGGSAAAYRQRGLRASRRSSMAMLWRRISPWARPAGWLTGWSLGAARAANAATRRRLLPPSSRRPTPSLSLAQPESEHVPIPPSHAQLCCCGAAIGLAFVAKACGGKEKARRMIDPDLQQKFAQPLHRRRARVFRRQHRRLRRHRRSGAELLVEPSCSLRPRNANPAPRRACGIGRCPLQPRAPCAPSSMALFNPFAWMLPPPRAAEARSRPPCRPTPAKP